MKKHQRKTLQKRSVIKGKQPKGSVHEIESKYKAIFNRTLCYVYVHDFEGNFLDANDAILNLLGYTREDIPLYNISSLVAEDQVPIAFQAIQEIKKKGAQQYPIEIKVKKKSGEYAWLVAEGALIYKKGKPYAIQGVAHDITERRQAEVLFKESESKFRAIIEKLPNTVIYMAALDERSTTLYISPQIRYILGYTQEEYGDDPDIWAKSIHSDDYERVMAELARCHKTGEHFISEYRMIRKDGQIIWFRDEAHIIKDNHGKNLFLLGINTDITERKQAEESLIQRQKELQLKTHSLEELNTALNVILKKREDDKAELEEKIMGNIKNLVEPYLEKLKKGNLDESQKSYVGIVESNLKEITSAFSFKLSSQYLNLTPSEIQVANLIKQGKMNKEIASLLGTSTRTIAFHRENIRRKLAIRGRKPNLKSFLMTQPL